MDSSYLEHHQSNQQQHQMSTGLTRYRSAPSSYFAGLLTDTGYGGGDLDHLINPQASNQDVFSRYMNDFAGEDSNTMNFSRIERGNSGNLSGRSHFMAPLKHEIEVQQLQQQQTEGKNYSSGSQMMYQSQSQVHQQSLDLEASVNSNRLTPMKMGGGPGGGGGNSGLIRHSSSPAGLFDQIDIQNEYGAMRGAGTFGGGNTARAEATLSSSSRFKSAVDFSSGLPSSGKIMASISEPESKRVKDCDPADGVFGESQRNDGSYMTGFPVASWDDTSIISDEFLQGLGDNDTKLFSSLNASDIQKQEPHSYPPTRLSHHLSLPTSSAELSALEKLSEDTVLCKIRAKRGCATHPRSIAERVRRTRISERMRKLQDLVPNMDKQTNTADMLDLAVDYIKDLEDQLKALQDNRAKCTCK